MNAARAARFARPLQHEKSPVSRIASLALAFALLGTLAGCGKSSKQPTAPVNTSGNGPQNQSDARQVAQQSAATSSLYLQQVKNLLSAATVHGAARPAAARPSKGPGTASDSLSLTYAFQGYDLSGNPIDLTTQHSQLASLGIDYRWYYNTNTDSLLLDENVASHGRVAGLDSLATQYVANAADSMFVAYNGYSAGYHIIYDYTGTSQATNLAWEKSETPTYPVAGTFALHWHYIYEYWYGAQHGTGNVDTNATITFNGTRYASVVVGTYTFTLDLQTGVVS